MWSNLEILGTTASGDAHLTMDSDDNACGSSGCNRFRTTGTQSGSVLSFGPIAAMRVGWPGAQEARESAPFDLFAVPFAVSHDAQPDQITLTATSGATLIL